MATATGQCLTEGNPFKECVESCIAEDGRDRTSLETEPVDISPQEDVFVHVSITIIMVAISYFNDS